MTSFHPLPFFAVIFQKKASVTISTAASASSASSGAAASGKGLSELFTYETSGREIESWNMLYSQQAIDFNVTTNIIDGLVSFDNYGKPVPALAKSWEHNEDSTVWTFHLRDDVDWVDMNGEVQDHLTSKDFLVGFEWVLNAKKNQAANTSMPSTTVVGAADYYDKTYAMDDAAAAALTYDDMLAAGVGIDAPDDYTVVYTCINPCPYFDTVASYVCCYPAPPALVEKLASRASAAWTTPSSGAAAPTSSRNSSPTTPSGSSRTPTIMQLTSAAASSACP